MSRMILSTQNSSLMALEDLLLSTKQLHAANIKVKNIYGVWKTMVLWGVALCEYCGVWHCVSIVGCGTV